MNDLELQGWTVVPTRIDSETLCRLRDEILPGGAAGSRCLLDHSLVKETVIRLREELAENGQLPSGTVAIQAVGFDKTPEINWKVAWHQDLMFPFAAPVRTAGYTLPCKKDGVDYARPPRKVLEEMLTVRLHLDDCDETNGPLHVCTGSHRHGILDSGSILLRVKEHPQATCLAKTGDALLLKPLIVHASSQAAIPRHRRVLHVVYHSGPPPPEPWYRAV
jgi:ectoine hydroxylase-related dioxygenase (phytanoyl-CoA dioxygenase family)